ncbi:MAG: hypothetical protein ACRD3E_06905 [Terriglobales bacterium]
MHFEDKVWTDFVRETIHPDTRSAVEHHLAEGCSECSKALAAWQMLAGSANKERAYAPPPDVVRMVKQEYSIQHPQAHEKTTLLASLIFDSFAATATAGVRGATAGARQLLYSANDITIDLHFEFQPTKSRAVVVGQVLENKTASPMPIPLLLFNEKGAAVMETETSEYGEFQFEFDTNQCLRLSFELAGNRRVQVPLSDVHR